MFQICLWHMYDTSIFTHGYIAVDFFFILSGFLLYCSFINHPDQTVINYIISRIKSFYPKYLFAFFLISLCNYKSFIPSSFSFFDIVDIVMKRIPEFFMLHETGIFINGSIGSLNGPTWYLSTLVLVSGFIYSMLRYSSKLFLNILGPLGVLFSYVLILHYCSNDNSLAKGNVILGFYAPLLRAFGGIGLGVMLSKFSREKKSFYSYYLVLIALLISIYCSIAYLYYDSVALLAYCYIIMFAFNKNPQILSQRVWGFLGKRTFDMLITHLCVVRIIFYLRKFVLLNILQESFIYLSLVVLFAIMFDVIFSIFRLHFNRYFWK